MPSLSSHPSSVPSSKPSAEVNSMSSISPSISSKPSNPFPSMSHFPSMEPSSQPSLRPSLLPSYRPTPFLPSSPTNSPIRIQSLQPIGPTQTPTVSPSSQPSVQPSSRPSLRPSKDTPDTSAIPTITPATSAPTVLPTKSPTIAPVSSPTQDPTNQTPTISPIDFSEGSIEVIIPSNLVLCDFVVSDSTTSVLQKTIKEEAQLGLQENTQQVEDVFILSFRDTPSLPNSPAIEANKEESMVSQNESFLRVQVCLLCDYQLILQELCRHSCQEQTGSSTMYDNVTSHLTLQIESGEFTLALDKNAAECGDDCKDIQNSTAKKGLFGEAEVHIVTPTPTQNPTTMSKSTKSATTVQSKSAKSSRPSMKSTTMQSKSAKSSRPSMKPTTVQSKSAKSSRPSMKSTTM
ncbi:hypothetical protein ACHAWF_000671, partial [Thalassiosira exigua]